MVNTQKLHVVVEREVLLRILPVVATEFDGNVSQYIRVTIFNDLLRRNLLTAAELKILKGR